LEPFHQRAFDTARSAMEQVQNKYVEPIIIPPDADSAHVTGFHTAGGMSSRYNAHREGFVFSDQGCIDGKVLQETGDGDNFVGQFHQAQWMMFQSLQGIANHILQNMESAMELPKGWFQQNLGPTDTSSQWHMKRYIQQQHQETEDGSSAQTTESGRRILLPMHTDPSLISVVIHDWSLLPAHDAGTNLMGLQVLETQYSNWKDLQRNTSNKNCVLATVFVGSVLAHITEATWPAAKHRVVDASSSSAAARMAATLFVRPQSSAVLPTPLPSPKLSKSTLKSKQPVTFGKWLQRVAKNYESKKQNTDPKVLLSDAKDNDKNQDLDSKTISSCHVCGADCHTRCTLCKYVYYCSVRCQRIDWKEGSHRTTCSGRKKPKKTTKQTEKLPMLGPLPAKLRNDDDVQHALDELVSLTNWSGDKQRDKEKRNGRQSTSEAIPDQPKSNCTKEESEMSLQNAPSYSLIAGIAHLDDSVVSYMVEDMPQISCYKLALKRQISTQSPNSSLNLKISVEQKASAVHSNRTLILVQADGMKADTPLFVGEFPHPLEKDGIRLQTEKEREPDSLLDVYHISLPYPQELASSSVLQGPCNISGGAMQLTSLQDINGVACGRCSSTLFSCVLENGQDRPQKSVIEKVLPMPQGRWDDVAEYLICYSGVSPSASC
jgi:isopenicillin N synthase-like dioxygenase